jgi:hypothetical protein
MGKAGRLAPSIRYSSRLDSVGGQTLRVPEPAFIDVCITGNDPWYTDPTDYPVKRLKTSLKQIFPTWNISLPSDSKCPLVASGNIGGRYINSVPKSKVCLRPAIPDHVKGEFIHIEQAIESRKSEVYEAWGKAVRETFEPVCAPGMAVHPRKLLCVDGGVAEEARAWPWGYLHSRQGLPF